MISLFRLPFQSPGLGSIRFLRNSIISLLIFEFFVVCSENCATLCACTDAQLFELVHEAAPLSKWLEGFLKSSLILLTTSRPTTSSSFHGRTRRSGAKTLQHFIDLYQFVSPRRIYIGDIYRKHPVIEGWYNDLYWLSVYALVFGWLITLTNSFS